VDCLRIGVGELLARVRSTDDDVVRVVRIEVGLQIELQAAAMGLAENVGSSEVVRQELPVDAEVLRAYARFPQGPPPGFGR